MPFNDAPAFIAELRADKRIEARALEFTVLAVARTDEVVAATWGEFDLKKRLWTIPGQRMKSGREHRVPLCDRAVEILGDLKHHGRRVFDISNTALLRVLQERHSGVTVHGFRSTFRDWAAERTN